MLRILALLPLTLLTGCFITLNVPEDRVDWDEEGSGLRFSGHRYRNSPNEPSSAGVLAGIVVNAGGKPVKGHVSAVSASGSHSQGVGEDGVFSLGPLRPGRFNLTASTDEGLFTILPNVELEHGEGLAGLTLTLQPGATLEVSYEGGRESVRCAVFHKGLRTNDWTVRQGQSSSAQAPPGRLSIQLYSGDAVYGVREVMAAANTTQVVTFELD